MVGGLGGVGTGVCVSELGRSNMITVLLPPDVLVAINAKFVNVPTSRSNMAHPTTRSSYVVQESILRASANEKGTPNDA